MADPDPSLTPEQKLLKLIEQPAQTADPSAGKAALAADPAGAAAGKTKAPLNFASLFSPSGIKGRIAYAKDKWKELVKDRKDPVNFRQVNRIVKMITVGFGLYLIGAITVEVSSVYKNFDSQFVVTPKEMADAPAAQTRKIDANLFDDVQNRNIFMPQEKRAAAGETAETQSESIKLVEITKDLKLAGISLSPNDASRTFCMIEDIKKNVTSFLKVGDTISGLRVDQITSNGIVLKHQKESIELR